MTENQIRKPLRIPKFDYAAPGAYFVTICTKNRQQCLGTVVVGADAHIGPRVELSEYGKIVEKYMQRIPGIGKYVIMPNHIHMIIEILTEEGSMWASTPTQSVSQRVRSFKTLVSKEIGVSLWQRSFYDHVIRSEAEYLEIWQYIDENPAHWAEDEYYTR